MTIGPWRPRYWRNHRLTCTHHVIPPQPTAILTFKALLTWADTDGFPLFRSGKGLIMNVYPSTSRYTKPWFRAINWQVVDLPDPGTPVNQNIIPGFFLGCSSTYGQLCVWGGGTILGIKNQEKKLLCIDFTWDSQCVPSLPRSFETPHQISTLKYPFSFLLLLHLILN